MATNSQSFQSGTIHNTALSYNDPYFISSNDNSNAQLGHVVFTGNNYINWHRSVTMALGAKNKLGFTNGSLVRPSDDSEDLEKWIRNDYMVCSLLINSIDKSIAESFMFVSSAQELWSEIAERYGHSTAPQLYDLHKNLMSVQQNDDSIAQYYNKLKKVWDQLHVLDPLPICTCGILLKCSCGFLKRIVEGEQLKKLIQFIAGLNKSYDQAKVNILSMDPLPSVNKVYHMLQQIERQNALANSQTLEMSALMTVSNNSNFQNSKFSAKKDVKDSAVNKNKLDRFCEFCKMKGHLKESCFKLVGYPDWYKGKTSDTSSNTVTQKSNQRLAANVQESPLDFSVQDSSFPVDDSHHLGLYKDFMKFMQMNQSAHSSTDSHSIVNFVDTIPDSQANSVTVASNSLVWVIDTGASDHMAISLDVFINTEQLITPLLIVLPDGTVKHVRTVGTVSLNSDITLSNVFYIPEFKHNLLSVAKLLDQHDLLCEDVSSIFVDIRFNEFLMIRLLCS
ncbi:uncharacterized protein LOC108225961 [Daucus carota subsp. sativus]|uniref:uncharacterized protein LOC108225961 n=1 Tax=Daucus carota subsp. sativus TaxID=79200 RepID=UPI0007EFD6FE|nr:PREDICTED: uncharacterized protein LOC108225961 [Daucus carota subsp. sativus]